MNLSKEVAKLEEDCKNLAETNEDLTRKLKACNIETVNHTIFDLKRVASQLRAEKKTSEDSNSTLSAKIMDLTIKLKTAEHENQRLGDTVRTYKEKKDEAV